MTASNREGSSGRPDIDRAFANIASWQKEAQEATSDPIAALRTFVDRYGDAMPQSPLAGIEIVPVAVNGMAAEWIVPASAAGMERLVYLHGGGWVAGGFTCHRHIAAALAASCDCAVLLVDYRLAPEHPFPAGLDDCVAALAWAAEHGPKGAAPAARLYLAGDSAGGNLAVAACRRTMMAGGRIPDRMVLLSPVLDCNANPARGEAVHRDVDSSSLEAMAKLYLQGRTALDDPEVSPLCAGDETLTGMPPTLLQASGSEYLRWDSEEFARRLSRAGARAVLSIWSDMPHVWHAFMSLLPEAHQAIREIADFLRQGDPAIEADLSAAFIQGDR